MKSYGWLPLVAALLITLCEVLFFYSQSQAPQKQANIAAATTDVGSGTYSPGG